MVNRFVVRILFAGSIFAALLFSANTGAAQQRPGSFRIQKAYYVRYRNNERRYHRRHHHKGNHHNHRSR